MARMNGLFGVVVSSFAVLVIVLVGWFFFVSPQRSKADRLGAQVDSAKATLSDDEQLLATAKQQNTLGNARAAVRALPDEARIPEILRQLTAFAAESRTELDNITPGTPLQLANGQALPVNLTFRGRYFGLQKLLKLMRQSASVSGSKIVSKGRLYTVDGIQFAGAQATPGQAGSNADIQATISLNAFVYHAAPAATTSTGTSTATAAAPTG